jgi:hypothetical protein
VLSPLLLPSFTPSIVLFFLDPVLDDDLTDLLLFDEAIELESDGPEEALGWCG